MKRTVVIGDRGPLRDDVARALGEHPGIELVRCMDGHRPVAATLAPLRPAIVLLLEPGSAPMPAALIRDARTAAPQGVLIVRVAEPTPTWVAEALNAGATTVLPDTVDAEALGRVVTEIVTEIDSAREALRLAWAA